MLDEDFQSMFQVLDRTKKGFLTSIEIQEFYETLFFQKVEPILVCTELYYVETKTYFRTVVLYLNAFLADVP